MDDGEILLAVNQDGTVAESIPAAELTGLRFLERQHLQEWIVAHPSILGGSTMIVAVEYDAWVVDGDAQRDRLDILGLDLDGRLVVAELKRGRVSDSVEMQAVKYAAMASKFSLDTLGHAYATYSTRRGTSLTPDQAVEALQSHADITEDSLANPRLVIVAQSFGPVVISSVAWLAEHGIDISLVRFQPYRYRDGHTLITFTRMFPLPDLEKSLVAPGMRQEPATDKLPHVEWTVEHLVALGRVANVTTLTTLDLCADRPDEIVTLTEVVEAAGVSRSEARGQLAGLTMTVKRRFGRKNWPFTLRWAADGTQQASYVMATERAADWLRARAQLDAEQSDDPDAS